MAMRCLGKAGREIQVLLGAPEFMRLNKELQAWYEKIDPEKIKLIHQLAKQHNNSFRQELALIVKRGVTTGWLKPIKKNTPNSV